MTDDKILEDHRWERTTLVPPFVDRFGDDLEYVRWKAEIVPEILWIGMLTDYYGPRKAGDITGRCVTEAQDISSDDDFAFASDYDRLSESEFRHLTDELGDKVIEDLETALKPLASSYPGFPLLQFYDSQPESDSQEELHLIADVVSGLVSRRSKTSTYVQGIYLATLFETGRIKITSGIEFGDLTELFNYPETDESQKVASHVRASISAVWGAEWSDRKQSNWADHFWERGFEITDCIFPQEMEEETEAEGSITEPDEEFFRELAGIGFEYEEDLKHKIIDLWYEAPDNPSFPGKNAVLDGLLMRQVNLSSNVATSPSMWATDIAGIILRCMTENQITLEWLNQEGEYKDYKQFIDLASAKKNWCKNIIET